jgi:anti-anti-sigma factor
MKILVIDDEKPTLSMFKLFLDAYGYDVYVAENGEQGLDLFNEISPDIVFTDIKMPGIDGLEVLRQIRTKDRDTQVIIITGHGDMEKAIEALDLDASDFINKPVERQALNSALSRVEKRIKMTNGIQFKINEGILNNILQIDLKGKMTGENKPLFSSILSDPISSEIKKVQIVLNDTFSINRSGIALLTGLLQGLKEKNIPISIDNLSYNYARVFQMAGIDKLADLNETLPED